MVVRSNRAPITPAIDEFQGTRVTGAPRERVQQLADGTSSRSSRDDALLQRLDADIPTRYDGSTLTANSRVVRWPFLIVFLVATAEAQPKPRLAPPIKVGYDAEHLDLAKRELQFKLAAPRIRPASS